MLKLSLGLGYAGPGGGGTSESQVPGTPGAPSLGSVAITSLTASFTSAGTVLPSTGFDLRYSTDNEETWVEVIGVTSPHPLSGFAGDTNVLVQVREKNAIGNGAWSQSAGVDTLSGLAAAFAPADWGVSTGTGTGAIDVLILALPDVDGGASVTDLKLSTDGGQTFSLVGSTTNFSTVAPIGDTEYGLQILAVTAHGDGLASETKTVTSGTTTIVLSNYSDTFAAGGSTFELVADQAGDGATLFYEFHSSPTYPGRGSGSIASGSAGALAAGPNSPPIDLSAVKGQEGYLFLTAGADGESNVLPTSTPTQFTVGLEPVLTLPTASANGSNGATNLGVTTDEDNGTLHIGIYATAATPSDDDIIAGTGAVASGSGAVSATGVQSFANVTGLTAGTAYKAHYVHVDTAGNKSNVATSAEFTPAATGITYVGGNTATEGENLNSITLTLPTTQADDFAIIDVSFDKQAPTNTPAAAVSGYTELINRVNGSGRDRQIVTFYKKLGASESNPQVTFTGTARAKSAMVRVYRGVDATTPFDVTYNESSHTSGGQNNVNPTNDSIATVTNNAAVLLGLSFSEQEVLTAGAPTGYALAEHVLAENVNHITAHLLDAGAAGSKQPGPWTNIDDGQAIGGDYVHYILALRPAA